jgi:glycerol-3-phosphate acyltransferase PlsY
MAWAFPLVLATGRLLGFPLGLPEAAAAAPEAAWRDGLLLLALLALVVTLRHAGNFVRIRAGTEHRAGQRLPLERLDKS